MSFFARGPCPPYLPQAQQQNQVLARALAAAANSFALGGYDVVVDGVVGPWLIEPWLQLAREGCPVHYILLRAGKEETMARALGRDKLDKSLNARLVEVMWEQFQGLGAYEPYGLDTTRLCAEETARLVLERVESKKALLPPGGEG